MARPGTHRGACSMGLGWSILVNRDISLLKETHFSEAKALEFRLETFNTFDHAQFCGAHFFGWQC